MPSSSPSPASDRGLGWFGQMRRSRRRRPGLCDVYPCSRPWPARGSARVAPGENERGGAVWDRVTLYYRFTIHPGRDLYPSGRPSGVPSAFARPGLRGCRLRACLSVDRRRRPGSPGRAPPALPSARTRRTAPGLPRGSRRPLELSLTHRFGRDPAHPLRRASGATRDREAPGDKSISRLVRGAHRLAARQLVDQVPYRLVD